MEIENKEIGCQNYKVYLDLCSKHNSFIQQNDKYVTHTKITILRQLYFNMKSIINEHRKDGNYDNDIFEEARNNKYYREIYGVIGCFFKSKLDEKRINLYLNEIRSDIGHIETVDEDRYFDLFWELLGYNSLRSLCV